jgi:hypothetical protein
MIHRLGDPQRVAAMRQACVELPELGMRPREKRPGQDRGESAQATPVMPPAGGVRLLDHAPGGAGRLAIVIGFKGDQTRLVARRRLERGITQFLRDGPSALGILAGLGEGTLKVPKSAEIERDPRFDSFTAHHSGRGVLNPSPLLGFLPSHP